MAGAAAQREAKEKPAGEAIPHVMGRGMRRMLKDLVAVGALQYADQRRAITWRIHKLRWLLCRRAAVRDAAQPKADRAAMRTSMS